MYEGTGDPPRRTRSKLAICPDSIRAGSPPKREFGKHHRNTEQKNAQHVHQQKRSTSALLSLGRKPPNVTQTYGRAYSSRHKAYLTPEFIFFCHKNSIIYILINAKLKQKVHFTHYFAHISAFCAVYIGKCTIFAAVTNHS